MKEGVSVVPEAMRDQVVITGDPDSTDIREKPVPRIVFEPVLDDHVVPDLPVAGEAQEGDVGPVWELPVLAELRRVGTVLRRRFAYRVVSRRRSLAHWGLEPRCSGR